MGQKLKLKLAAQLNNKLTCQKNQKEIVAAMASWAEADNLTHVDPFMAAQHLEALKEKYRKEKKSLAVEKAQVAKIKREAFAYCGLAQDFVPQFGQENSFDESA